MPPRGKYRPHFKFGNRAYMVDSEWLSRRGLYEIWRTTCSSRSYYRNPAGEVVSGGRLDPIRGVRINSQEDFVKYAKKREFPTKGRRNAKQDNI